MPKIFYVYLITNLISNKQYVGSHISYKAIDNYWGSSKYLKEDYKLYNIENFSKIILNTYENKIDMLNGESENILKYNTLAPNGYNRFLPNDRIGFHMGGVRHKKETLEKMRKPHKPFSEETKQKMRKPKTAEHKKVLSERAKGKTTNKGRKHSEQSKKNMASSHLGKTLSEEHKLNISRACLKKHKNEV